MRFGSPSALPVRRIHFPEPDPLNSRRRVRGTSLMCIVRRRPPCLPHPRNLSSALPAQQPTSRSLKECIGQIPRAESSWRHTWAAPGDVGWPRSHPSGNPFLSLARTRLPEQLRLDRDGSGGATFRAPDRLASVRDLSLHISKESFRVRSRSSACFTGGNSASPCHPARRSNPRRMNPSPIDLRTVAPPVPQLRAETRISGPVGALPTLRLFPGGTTRTPSARWT